jgi:hypothetical protein
VLARMTSYLLLAREACIIVRVDSVVLIMLFIVVVQRSICSILIV